MDGSYSDVANTRMLGATLLGDVLEHHGVKGQKWGVRKDAGHDGESAKNSKIAKLDKKFEKNAGSNRQILKAFNTAGRNYANEDIERINNKPQYKNADFSKPSALRTKYYDEHTAALTKQLDKHVASLGTNASGTKKYNVVVNDDGSWDIHSVDVKHDDASVRLKVTYDAKGFIKNVEAPENTLMQGELVIGEILMHHGIPGMKWGHRKGSSDSSGVKTSSSHVSEDHLMAEKHKVTIKEQGVKALSNNDLKRLNERMQLEQTYNNLKSQKSSTFDKGHNKVQTILKVGKTLNDIHNTINGPAGKLAKTAFKNASKAAKVVEAVTEE